MTVEQAYQYLFITALVVIGILIGVVLVRSIIGPRITDRILCINIIGTLVICSAAILSQMLREDYLVDIALIYAMLSFLTVLILATVYIRSKRDEAQAGEEGPGREEGSVQSAVSTKAGAPVSGEARRAGSVKTVPGEDREPDDGKAGPEDTVRDDSRLKTKEQVHG